MNSWILLLTLITDSSSGVYVLEVPSKKSCVEMGQEFTKKNDDTHKAKARYQCTEFK